MDYKEKYEMALKRARVWKDKSGMPKDKQGILDDIFPELAESEDEKIRKALIAVLKSDFETDTTIYDISVGEIIAWLEKQKTSEEAIEYIKKHHSPSKVSDFQAAMNISVAKAYDQGVKDALEKQGKPLENYDEAEKEKADFVGNGFIECHANFLDFKEGNTYWLEYIGDDKYNVRSDNLLGKTYHITPCQLYTVFKKLTWLEKQGEKKVSYTTTVETGDGGINALVTRYTEMPLNSMNNKDEERLRKTTIAFLKDFAEQGYENAVECINWLEKQGEQKKSYDTCDSSMMDNKKSPYGEKRDFGYFEENPADKVEPKFRVGDWITNGQLTCKILSVTGKSYELHLYNDDYCHFETDVQSIDKDYHLWTIEDAKCGDVLASKDGVILIFRRIGNERWNDVIDYHCLYNCYNGEFNIPEDLEFWGYVKDTQLKPSTKEQRDTLTKAMADAGYIFDFEKKELKKMKVTSSTYCSENCKGYQETGKCFADGECDSKRKYDNMLDSCEIEHIEDGKFYYCIKDYYAGGNKRASKGDVIQAHRGMSMMALGSKANEYFLPVKRCSLSFVDHLDV